MQPHYVAALHTLSAEKKICAFGTSRATLTWILHSRPAFSYTVNRFAQVTENTLSEMLITALNKAIKSAKK